MPPVTIYSKDKEHLEAITKIFPQLTEIIAKELTYSKRQLTSKDIMIDTIISESKYNSPDTLITIKADNPKERVRKEDNISSNIKKYITENCPEAGTVGIALELSDMGWSFDNKQQKKTILQYLGITKALGRKLTEKEIGKAQNNYIHKFTISEPYYTRMFIRKSDLIVHIIEYQSATIMDDTNTMLTYWYHTSENKLHYTKNGLLKKRFISKNLPNGTITEYKITEYDPAGSLIGKHTDKVKLNFV